MQNTSIKHSKFNILIAEDESESLTWLCEVLTEQGFNVNYSIDVLSLIERAKFSVPDLILLNVKISNLDGYQICEELKNNPITGEIPVIFLSSTEEVVDRVKAFKVGAKDYIVKPFSVEELSIKINNQLHLKQSKAEIAQLNKAIEQEFRAKISKLEETNKKLYKEIERRKTIEQQLLHQTLYDKLTGLANHALLIDHIEQAIKNSLRHYNKKFALLCINIDRFQIINDSVGHGIGDRIIKEIANRLKKNERTDDTVARLGRDEFVVLLQGIHSIDDAIKVTKRIQNQLNKPIIIEENEINITTSIGITINSNNSGTSLIKEQADYYLRDANIAMSRAKSRGEGLYEIFDSSMQNNAVKRLKLENDLRQAIRKEEFAVYYQTIVSLATKEIKGFEALIRWHHPKYGLVSPNEFIPIAEETELIIPIDLWILEKSCYQLSVWQKQFISDTPLTMSINISGRHFSEYNLIRFNLIKYIDRILDETGLDGSSLKLEITERILIDNAESAKSILQQLRDRNIQLCLDDFGTGYSSLSYLHKFPFDTLKIDRSFINQMAEEQKNHEIVKMIINLGSNLGMSVVAEGIETEEQFLQLQILDCDYGQGYWFSHPVDAPSFKYED